MSGAPPDPRAHARRVQWERLALVVLLLIGVWVFFRLFSSVLLPFVMAAGLAYFLDPAVSKLERLGLRRSGGALLLLAAFVFFVTLFILLLYPVISDQASALAQNLPSYINTAQKDFGRLITDLQYRLGPGAMSAKLRDIATNQAGEIVSFTATAASNIIDSGFAVVNVLSLFVVTPIVTFYFLRDWPAIISHVDSWLPRPFEATIRAQAIEVNRILSAWVRGQAVCCLFLAVLYALGLTVVGLDLGLIIGLLSGFLSFIPYAGTLFGGATAILITLSDNQGWHGVFLVLLVFGVAQGLNDYLIQPRFLGDKLGLPAVWVIFSLFAGGAVFGFLGIMLAVPITATIGVLARFWLRRYLTSSLYLDPPPE
jgi:predicted PurR-regulated permease PerM